MFIFVQNMTVETVGIEKMSPNRGQKVGNGGNGGNAGGFSSGIVI